MCLLLGFASSASGLVPVESPSLRQRTDAETFKAVDRYLEEQLRMTGIPGAAIVIVKDGQQVHEAASVGPTNPGGP